MMPPAYWHRAFSSNDLKTLELCRLKALLNDPDDPANPYYLLIAVLTELLNNHYSSGQWSVVSGQLKPI